MSLTKIDVHAAGADVNYAMVLPASISDPVVSSAGAAATATMAATTDGTQNVISQVFCSYSATPTGGRITIADSNGTLFDQDIVGTNPGTFTFSPPLTSQTPGSALTVTLASGGGAVVAKVVVRGWLEK